MLMSGRCLSFKLVGFLEAWKGSGSVSHCFTRQKAKPFEVPRHTVAHVQRVTAARSQSQFNIHGLMLCEGLELLSWCIAAIGS